MDNRKYRRNIQNFQKLTVVCTMMLLPMAFQNCGFNEGFESRFANGDFSGELGITPTPTPGGPTVTPAPSPSATPTPSAPTPSPTPTPAPEIPDHSNAISWSGQLAIPQNTSMWRYQGYFPHTQPWIPQGHTVLAPPPPTASGMSTNPGNFIPVTYQVFRSMKPGDKLLLESYLHPDGGETSYCENFGSFPSNSISVRNCTSEYPLRSLYNGGLGWWTFFGGGSGHPEYATNASGERIAESILSVAARHADSIDLAAGIRLRGQSYGAAGSIMQSMIIPKIQDRLVVVQATNANTLFVKNLVDPAVAQAWGNANRDSVDFRKVVPLGKVDHIFYRISGGYTDTLTKFDVEFFEICKTYKIACLGTWHGGGHSDNEPGITLPWWDLYPGDTNMTARLDKPLPVFTNSTGNNMGLRGHYNLGLSWNTSGITHSPVQLKIPLKYKAYKNMTNDQVAKPFADMPNNITVSVTVRRSQSFIMSPGSRINWAFGAQSGSANVDNKGEVTIDNLNFSTSDAVYTNLVLTH